MHGWKLALPPIVLVIATAPLAFAQAYDPATIGERTLSAPITAPWMQAAAVELVGNGSFETGDFASWNIDSQGDFGGWFVTGDLFGPWSENALLSGPSDGSFQALVDQSGPGRHILYQDVALPPNSSATLNLVWWYENFSGVNFDAGTLDYLVSPNQHVRVDIMDPTAPIDDTGAGVLENLYISDEFQPVLLPPEVLTADLTPYAGQTVRLRIAEVDNLLFFNVGIDAVSIQVDGVGGDTLELALGDGFGLPGTQATVPFTVSRLAVPKAGDPSQLAGIDLQVDWDAERATLVDVLLSEATTDWLMEFNPSSGTVDISMASLTTIDPPVSGVDMLTLEFALPGIGSSTPITSTPLRIVGGQAFDLNQDPINHVTRDGAIFFDCEKGDVIADGEVNSADALRTLLFAMNMATPTADEFCAADMNGDGMIDVGDAVLVLRKAVGAITATPVGGEPGLYVRADGTGEVLIEFGALAGLELTFTYDAQAMAFLSAESRAASGLVAVNDQEPGKVRVGFATSYATFGKLALRFDVQDLSSPLRMQGGSVYEESGVGQPIEPLTTEIYFGVTAAPASPSPRTQLLAARPNPFNPRTLLSFVLAAPGDATLRVFDLAGREVRAMRLSGLSAGEHAVAWEGRDDAGAPVASGPYIVRLEANGQTDARQVLLLK